VPHTIQIITIVGIYIFMLPFYLVWLNKIDFLKSQFFGLLLKTSTINFHFQLIINKGIKQFL